MIDLWANGWITAKSSSELPAARKPIRAAFLAIIKRGRIGVSPTYAIDDNVVGYFSDLCQSVDPEIREHILKTHLLITLTSPDRPGIVERVTEVVTGHGGNWEECRMAHLGGDFAGIVKVSVATENANQLSDALRALADEQLTVAVRTTDPSIADAKDGLGFLTLRLEGADHEGIVHKVSAFLAEQKINVEAMETEIVHAPITASPLFQMEAQIKPPAGVSLAGLAGSLEQIGEELGVDITITAGKD